MTETERAEEYADSFIRLFQRKFTREFCISIIDPDFIWGDENFQEMVMQQIRIKGYQVTRVNDADGLALKLTKIKTK